MNASKEWLEAKHYIHPQFHIPHACRGRTRTRHTLTRRTHDRSTKKKTAKHKNVKTPLTTHLTAEKKEKRKKKKEKTFPIFIPNSLASLLTCMNTHNPSH